MIKKIHSFPIGLFCLLIMPSLNTNALGQSISLENYQVEKISSTKTKVSFGAKSKDCEVGSFFVRLDSKPEGSLPSGFFVAPNGYIYLAEVSGGSSNLLLDNGEQDEDSQSGKFAHTFTTSDWVPGAYVFRIGAHNRPRAGNYIHDSRYFHLMVGSDSPAISNVPSAEHRVIYKRDGIYACFPDLFHLPDGKIRIHFGTKVTRTHIDQGTSKQLTSADGGNTWQDGTGPTIDVRWRTDNGNLVFADAVGWVYTNADERPRLEAEHRILDFPKEGIAYLGGARSHVSYDNGKTWKIQKIDVPADCLGLMNHYRVAAHLVSSSGVRVTATYGRRYREDAPHKQGKDEVYILRSVDDGKSWTCRPMYPEGLPNPEIGYNETALIEVPDGKILALMRSTIEDGLWQATSSDDGETWSAPVKTPINGYPAHAIRLKDGRILCAYSARKVAPMGIRAVISEDNGNTWKIKDEMILRSDGLGSPSDLGYPVLHERPDGSVIAIYYITTDGVDTHIASTTFNP